MLVKARALTAARPGYRRHGYRYGSSNPLLRPDVPASVDAEIDALFAALGQQDPPRERAGAPTAARVLRAMTALGRPAAATEIAREASEEEGRPVSVRQVQRALRVLAAAEAPAVERASGRTADGPGTWQLTGGGAR